MKWATKATVSNDTYESLDNPAEYAATLSAHKAARDHVTLLGEAVVTWQRLTQLDIEIYYMNLNKVDPGKWEPPVQPDWPVQVGDWVVYVVWDAQKETQW